jgi:hypothetical protein
MGGAADMEADYDDWLSARLGALGIDAEVYAPFVTGLLEDDSLLGAERDGAVLELLEGAAGGGAVPPETAEEIACRWERRCRLQQAEQAAAASAVLEKYASEAAERRAADEHAALLRREKQNDLDALEKQRVLSLLEDAQSDDEQPSDGEDVRDPQEASGREESAEVQRARELVRQRTAERREAIVRAVEREDKKKAEGEQRRVAREQAGHAKASPSKPTKAAKTGKS